MKDGLGLQLKPVGSHCNLRCNYCYARPFLSKSLEIMSKEVLERSISGCILNSKWPKITWHGGEPTLPGLDFYKNNQDIFEKYRYPEQKVSQVLQTNGTLINKKFARFFKENGFEVGISIDGPREIHNMNRVRKLGQGSFDDTMHGLEVLDFLIKEGFRSIKYSPVFDIYNYKFNISDEDCYG